MVRIRTLKLLLSRRMLESLAMKTLSNVYIILFSKGCGEFPLKNPPGQFPRSNFSLVSPPRSIHWVRNSPGEVNRGDSLGGKLIEENWPGEILQGGILLEPLQRNKTFNHLILHLIFSFNLNRIVVNKRHLFV